MAGNPFATLHYRKSATNNMGMNMFRGFVINFVSVFLLCLLLLKNPAIDFKYVLSGCLVVGLVSYFTIPYINSIWFDTNSIPDLIDAVVSWGLCGLVLGWYLTRGQQAVS